jgi:hypothetical protein
MSSDELAKAGLLTGAAPEEDRAKLLQSQKAAFFFKLERELEKVRKRPSLLQKHHGGVKADGVMHSISILDQLLLSSKRKRTQDTITHID